MEAAGFIARAEGETLARWARACAPLGPCLEVGSYCGRSTGFLARAVAAVGGLVVAVDHHRGSEEHQPGETWHDPRFFDARAGRMDTLGALRDNLRRWGLEAHALAAVGSSRMAARVLPGPFGIAFLDGGHAMTTALEDWRLWGPRVAVGGLLVIHDVFADPKNGGRPPFVVHEKALASGLYAPAEALGCLRALRRVA